MQSDSVKWQSVPSNHCPSFIHKNVVSIYSICLFGLSTNSPDQCYHLSNVSCTITKTLVVLNSHLFPSIYKLLLQNDTIEFHIPSFTIHSQSQFADLVLPELSYLSLLFILELSCTAYIEDQLKNGQCTHSRQLCWHGASKVEQRLYDSTQYMEYMRIIL